MLGADACEKCERIYHNNRFENALEGACKHQGEQLVCSDGDVVHHAHVARCENHVPMYLEKYKHLVNLAYNRGASTC